MCHRVSPCAKGWPPGGQLESSLWGNVDEVDRCRAAPTSPQPRGGQVGRVPCYDDVMPKRFSLEVKNKAGDATAFELEFPDPEWTLIQDYAKKADLLCELPLVRRGLWENLCLLSGTTEKPLKPDPAALREGRLLFAEGVITADTSRFPPREELDALLYRLRRFILKREPTYFPRVLKLFSRKANHPVWAALRNRFTGTHSREMMRMQHSSNGVTREILSDDALGDWLNAFEYHEDPSKAADFNEIPSDHITSEAIRALMLELIAEKTIAVVEFRRFIASLDQGSGTFRFGQPSRDQESES